MSKSTSVFAIIAALVLAVPSAVLAEASNAKTSLPVSKAVTEQLVDAIAIEMERSMTIRIPGAPAPYFISYKLTEVEVNDATSSLGALTASRDRHFVSLEAHVHVGEFERDNTNFVIPQREMIDGIANAQLPLEASPEVVTKLVWLVTDQAYKEALQQFTAKEDALRSGASGRGVPSYSKSPKLVMETPVVVPALETKQALVARSRKLSRFFRDKPAIRDSRVSFTSFLERRWYLNSEGTSSHDTRRVSGVLIVASGQADDGQELNLYYSRYGQTAADLPSDAELEQAAATVVKNIDGLSKAPLVDAYTGPVLFEGEGAVGVVHHALSPHLSGTPRPVGVSAQESSVFGGAFEERLGRKVLAPFLSIHDDPSISKSGKTAIIGGYRFDDEGVRAQRIDIVKDGKLLALPMSRTPSKTTSSSNGHARRTVAGGLFRGSPTNLFIKAKGGQSRSQLLKKLKALLKEEGLPYGIIIRQFDDVAVTANPELSRVELYQLLQSFDPNAPPMASLAYRVFPDGREELVRGVQLKPIEVNAWRRVTAAGKSSTIKNFLASTENPAFLRLAGGDQGFVPSSGVESSITTPDLLFPEITIERSAAGIRSKPAVSKP